MREACGLEQARGRGDIPEHDAEKDVKLRSKSVKIGAEVKSTADVVVEREHVRRPGGQLHRLADVRIIPAMERARACSQPSRSAGHHIMEEIDR